MNEDVRKQLFETFYLIPTKDLQDSHLCGLIDFEGVKQKRPRVGVVCLSSYNNNSSMDSDDDIIEGLNPNAASFYYKVRYQENEYRVSTDLVR